jgi:hypothetical protein
MDRTTRRDFLADLVRDIARLETAADRVGMRAAVRLNGTSDLVWESMRVDRDGVTYPNVMTAFPRVTFYDYTKRPGRTNLPANYSLTVSLAESNDRLALAELESGRNIAVVFRTAKGQPLPETFAGRPVVDGDVNDLRFMDPAGVVVGLRAKGRAKQDRSGFVRDGVDLDLSRDFTPATKAA